MTKDALVGAVLGGRYQIVSPIEEEVLGRIYLAEEKQQRRKVRVKLLHAFLTDNPEKVARFEREVQVCSALQHPNLIQMVDAGEHGPQKYIVFEQVDAISLKDVLAQGPIDAERAAMITAQVGRALEAVHSVGVVHRNLGPQNILLIPGEGGRDFVKVRDFGLAALSAADTQDESALTSAAARIGNVAYMAPEYIEEWKVSPQTDLYALGALFYHMCVGKPPFEGKYGKVIDDHVHTPPPKPTAAVPDLPPWTDAVVLTLMQKDPLRRPASGEGVARLLEKALRRSLPAPEPSKVGASKAPAASRAPAATKAPSKAPESGTSNGTKVAIAGAAGAGMVGLAIVLIVIVGGIALWAMFG